MLPFEPHFLCTSIEVFFFVLADFSISVDFRPIFAQPEHLWIRQFDDSSTGWTMNLNERFVFLNLESRERARYHSHLFPFFHWCAFIFQHFTWLFWCTTQSNAIEIFLVFFSFVEINVSHLYTLNMHICLSRFEKAKSNWIPAHFDHSKFGSE